MQSMLQGILLHRRLGFVFLGGPSHSNRAVCSSYYMVLVHRLVARCVCDCVGRCQLAAGSKIMAKPLSNMVAVFCAVCHLAWWAADCFCAWNALLCIRIPHWYIFMMGNVRYPRHREYTLKHRHQQRTLGRNNNYNLPCQVEQRQQHPMRTERNLRLCFTSVMLGPLLATFNGSSQRGCRVRLSLTCLLRPLISI